MLKLLGSAVVITSLGIAGYQCLHSNKKAQRLSPEHTAEENYASYCSGCHGEKMDAFVDRQWKHGSSLQEMTKGIRYGYANEGMPAFDSAFSDKEITELAQYIITGIENRRKYNFDETPKSNIFPSEKLTVRLDTVVSGIAVGWGMVFLPDGNMLVTERSGKILLVNGKKQKTALSGVPAVVAEGQGGMLDIALHPDFKSNHWVYFAYSKPLQTDSGLMSATTVMRARLDKYALRDQKIILEVHPYERRRIQFGSRLLFDKGKLFVTVGDMGRENIYPQNLSNGIGKIHRVNDDGSIPADNPFVGQKGADPSIYSYGHRNPQSLARNPFTGEIWSTEHGPRGGDEINIIYRGANYGWPVTSYGINYNGKIITNKTSAPGITDPLWYWIPSIAPSGMAFVTGDKYPAWKGNLLVGSLRFKYLDLCYLQNGKVVRQEMLLKNIGRLRDVRMGPDGYIYVSVEQPTAAIFRLLPQ